MSHLETFFACSFVSTFAVTLIATWFRYLPVIVSLYRTVLSSLEQPRYKEDISLKFKTYELGRSQAQF